METLFDFSAFPLLETDRLRLRRIVEADADAVVAILSDPQVTRYLLDDPDGTTPAQWPMVEWADRIYEKRSGFRWAITLNGSDTLIGTCGFHLWDHGHHRAETGYELDSRYWRQGLMREALVAVLRFGFERLDLHRVEADVTAGNEASAGLLRTLGFRQEGTWRERLLDHGRFRDLWQFGLLREEFHGNADARWPT